MDKMESLRMFLEENYRGVQAFNKSSLENDKMRRVYTKGNVKVDYCSDWQYLEIFGLTDKEFESLSDVLDLE